MDEQEKKVVRDQREKKLIRRVSSAKIYGLTVVVVCIGAVILHLNPSSSDGSAAFHYGLLVMIGMTLGYMIDQSERWSVIADPSTAAVRYYSNYITAISLPITEIIDVKEVVENKTFKRVSGVSSKTSGLKNPNDYINKRIRKVVLKTNADEHEVSGTSRTYGEEVKAAIDWLRRVSNEESSGWVEN